MFVLKKSCIICGCMSLIVLRTDCYYRNCILLVDPESNVFCLLRVVHVGCEIFSFCGNKVSLVVSCPFSSNRWKGKIFRFAFPVSVRIRCITSVYSRMGYIYRCRR